METSTMIRQLRRTAKKHENDKLLTFATDITAMCTDVANRLEELEKKNKEIRAKAIDEFVKEICKKYTEEESKGNCRQYCVNIKQDIADMAEQMKAGADNE